MSMYASANSCVDRLITKGSRDPASGLTQTADKRSDAGRGRQPKAGNVEKVDERDRSRCSTQTANGRDENRQHERLAVVKLLLIRNA